MTYRAGNHHGVTIVNEADTTPCGRDGHDCARGHLAAVVVNGDWELAERICALLNGDDLARAAIGSLTARRPIAQTPAVVRRGRDAHPPSGPLSAPVSASTPPLVGQDTPGDHSGSRVVAYDAKPGCPEREWDGPYVMRCGRGAASGECPRHGTYDLADVPERKADQA